MFPPKSKLRQRPGVTTALPSGYVLEALLPDNVSYLVWTQPETSTDMIREGTASRDRVSPLRGDFPREFEESTLQGARPTLYRAL